MSVLKYLDKKFELIVMAGFLVLFTVLMFANVVLRFLFNGSIVWAYELCRYCLVGSTFFSIPIWIRRRSGIRVDAVVTLLPKKVQKTLEIIIYAVMIAFFLFLCAGAAGVCGSVAASGQVSASMQMPIKYLYGIAVFCFALSAVRSAEVLIELLRGFGHEEKEAKGK